MVWPIGDEKIEMERAVNHMDPDTFWEAPNSLFISHFLIPVFYLLFLKVFIKVLESFLQNLPKLTFKIQESFTAWN